MKIKLTDLQEKNLKGFLENVIRRRTIEKAYECLINSNSYSEDNVRLRLNECDELKTIMNLVPEELKRKIIENKNLFNQENKVLNVQLKGDTSNMTISLDNLQDFKLELEAKLTKALGGNFMTVINPVELQNLQRIFASSSMHLDAIIKGLLNNETIIVVDEETPEGVAVNLSLINEKEVYQGIILNTLNDEQKKVFDNCNFDTYNVIEMRNLKTQQIIALRLKDLKSIDKIVEEFLLKNFPDLYCVESEMNDMNNLINKVVYNLEEETEEIDPDFSVDYEEETEEIDPGFSVIPRDEDGEYEPICLYRSQMRFIIDYFKKIGCDIYRIKELMEGTIIERSGIEYKIRLIDEFEVAQRLYPDVISKIQGYEYMFEKKPYLLIKPISSNQFIYNVIPQNDNANNTVLKENFKDILNYKLALIRQEEERKVEELLYEKYCPQPR